MHLLQLHQEIHVVWIGLYFCHQLVLVLYAEPLTWSTPWVDVFLSFHDGLRLRSACSVPSVRIRFISVFLTAVFVIQVPIVAWRRRGRRMARAIPSALGAAGVRKPHNDVLNVGKTTCTTKLHKCTNSIDVTNDSPCRLRITE
jgi:hypothetical protein